jgi:hypothetical protein
VKAKGRGAQPRRSTRKRRPVRPRDRAVLRYSSPGEPPVLLGPYTRAGALATALHEFIAGRIVQLVRWPEAGS